MQLIDEVDSLSPETFQEKILDTARPLVIRGFVKDWPLVAAARQSDKAFLDYLRRFDRGQPVYTVIAQPSTGGRLFYNDDLSGLNCSMGQQPVSKSLDFLLDHMDEDPGPTLALQSVIIKQVLPGMEQENRLPAGFVPDDINGRIWLGSRAIIAAHHDPTDNIACCVAGSRRFTLFPPEQAENLYVGPFELTPAGAAISMVDFDQPDYDRFPRYREAEASACSTVLRPGDALYIPYLWWHHVRSLEKVNGLVNYWWSREPDRAGDPRNALMHAMLAFRNLPPNYREAWQAMFNYYVFNPEASTAEHIPEDKRGILGDMGPEAVARLKAALSQVMK